MVILGGESYKNANSSHQLKIGGFPWQSYYEEQHQEAVGMIVSRTDEHDGYSVEEIDPEVVNVWISDAHADGDETYAEFLRSALAEGADIYTLYEDVGGWKQAVGEAAEYH